DEAMKVAITKFWGANINDIGNFCMAGHNYKNGTMFGKTKYLKVGDKIKMTDLNLNTIEYEIFKIYTIDPNDITCIESVAPNTREITLITCTNGHKNRLITKAREVIK
ncbi:MAG: sortase, partial [Clostridia bacterium]|nr:sortase [Clostridia bacterium]